MEFLQLWRECVARAAVRAGEDEQDSPTAKVREAEFTATIEPWQSEIRRGCAGFESIAFDFALCQGAIARSVPWDDFHVLPRGPNRFGSMTRTTWKSSPTTHFQSRPVPQLLFAFPALLLQSTGR
jgi:hypothetical protein